MALLLVTYEAGKEGTDYPKLTEKINRYSNTRITDTSYAIITDKAPVDVCGELKRHAGEENTVYVLTLKKPFGASEWNLVGDWLRKNLTD